MSVGYSVSGDVITVSGYWRLKGVTWKKCDGSLSFKENGFSPRLIDVSKRTTVEIIGELCK